MGKQSCSTLQNFLQDTVLMMKWRTDRLRLFRAESPYHDSCSLALLQRHSSNSDTAVFLATAYRVANLLKQCTQHCASPSTLSAPSLLADAEYTHFQAAVCMVPQPLTKPAPI